MLFMEQAGFIKGIIHHTLHLQNLNFLNVKTSGTYTYHCVWNCCVLAQHKHAENKKNNKDKMQDWQPLDH
jgi:hypothetical protein